MKKEIRQKISNSLKGRVFSHQLRENNHRWQETNISYGAVHKWLRREFGTPKYCENCDSIDKNVYDWANLSGTYERNISDWARLCRSCHTLIDGVGLYMRRRSIK